MAEDFCKYREAIVVLALWLVSTEQREKTQNKSYKRKLGGRKTSMSCHEEKEKGEGRLDRWSAAYACTDIHTHRHTEVCLSLLSPCLPSAPLRNLPPLSFNEERTTG